jgi:hypothetical protein
MTAPAPPDASSPPVGRHRNLGPLQRFLARTGSVLIVIAALGVGDFLLRITPDVDKRERSFLSAGEPGETVDAVAEQTVPAEPIKVG